ncbi:MAG: bifunctional 4-hydroxy-2-oxoglutarate aldolase/2-dehydro-3-deoxy-phosphogluconate aldolase, partial [Halopseudomonas sp.]
MTHFELVSKGIAEHKVFAIVRGVSPENIIPTVEALIAGGIKLLEVTFDRDGPMSDTLSCVETVRSTFGDKIVCGVGTATDEQQVNAAARAGAQFVVSPNVNSDVIRLSRQLGMVSIPGAFTPTEVVQARSAGADYVKLFPGGLL